jgi:hypothetical protein
MRPPHGDGSFSRLPILVRKETIRYNPCSESGWLPLTASHDSRWKPALVAHPDAIWILLVQTVALTTAAALKP